MNYYAKLSENGTLSSACANEGETKMIEQLLSEGFLPHEKAILPDEELGEFQSYELKHRSEDEKIVSYYDVISNDPTLIQQKIDELTTQLSATDYKVVKNHEYIDAGFEPYYAPMDLYNEREPLREQIRELEALLEE